MNAIKKSKYIKKRLCALLPILALISVITPAKAQHVSVSAKLDSMLIFIGGQIDLTLEVSQPKGVQVNFPFLTDTVSKSIEIVESAKPDTIIADNNQLLIKQVYRITSFDSGVHLVPPIVFELANDASQKFQTQAMALKVINPFDNVDPEKGIFDIKQPINTPFSLAELLPYLGYILAVLLLAAAIALFLIWRFNKKILPFIAKPKPIEPPHVIALRELDRIKQEKSWQKGQVKQFYIEITDVLRQYIELRFNLPALEQTTDETTEALKKCDGIEADTYKRLQQLLMLADLVKFAKYQPLPDQNDLSLINAYFFVNQTKMEEIKTVEEVKNEMEESLEKEI